MMSTMQHAQTAKKSVFQQAFFLKMVWVEVNGQKGADQEFRLVLNQLGSDQSICFDTFEALTTHLQKHEPEVCL